MSLTTKPQAIAPGAAVELATPTNQPWAQVVISNLSPYLVQVQAAGSVFWLNPWIENVFSTGSTHSPIMLSAQTPSGTTVPAGSSAQVQATWYGPEEKPEGTWPVSLTAQAVASAISGTISQGVDILDNLTPALVAGVPQFFTVTALHNYAGIVVSLGSGAGAAGLHVAMLVSATSFTGPNIPVVGIVPNPYPILGPNGNRYYFDCPVTAGQVITVGLESIGAGGTPEVCIAGVGAFAGVAPVAGLPLAQYPIGGYLRTAAQWPAPAAQAAAIPAPPTGMVIRLHSAFTDTATTGYIVENGATVIGYVFGGPSSIRDGQICAGACSIETHVGGSGGAGGTCYMTYDLISAPSLT